eukprot:TRINITY_DN5168_c0_g1_i2.p1 TRINITY_DN5168_c0_g1~~TRINITY_DN5168_c0_g1_i2.p1  ORF type:complete len:414 (-),score=86.87 TRINITY_DN5168_c0_g1_i2:225-1466(-)
MLSARAMKHALSSARRFRTQNIPAHLLKTVRTLPFGWAAGASSCVVAAGVAYCDAGEPAPQPDRAQVKLMADELQQLFVQELSSLPGANGSFAPLEWQRDQGTHGGGIRFQCAETKVFNRASVNVSGIHYDDKPKSPVKSATAISVILHPQNPFAPSMHFHISFIEPRASQGYWRMIADLNPSIPNPEHTAAFDATLSRVSPPGLLAAAKAFGDRYFWIPALERTRGITHFFAAKVDTELLPAEDTLNLAKSLTSNVVRCYVDCVKDALDKHPEAGLTAEDRQQQLAYHTLYLFQVLTLDKGTTYGLLAHKDNDVGTLGSLPCYVDKELLASWRPKMPEVQRLLLDGVLGALPDQSPSPVSNDTRARLAEVVRNHYKTNRAAVGLQAEMNMERWAEEVKPGLVLVKEMQWQKK